MSQTYQEIKATVPALHQTMEKIDAVLPALQDKLRNRPLEKMVYIGCGSSYCLAKSLSLMTTSWLGIPAIAIAAGDLILHPEIYKAPCENAWIGVISRSGETSEIVLAVDLLNEQGIDFSLIGLYGAVNSTLSQRSDFSIELPWAFDHSVCQTKNISCLYLAGAYLLSQLAKRGDIVDSLREAVAVEADFIDTYEPVIREIAKRDLESAVVMGDAEIGGLCDEGALAFKEICQIPSNYYHILDSRHGPIVMINEKSVAIIAMSALDNTLEKNLIADVAATGALVIVYSDLPVDLPDVMNMSCGRSLMHPARGLLVLMICQLLSYYIAENREVNPDQPKTLKPCIILQ